jgi:signal transduction histidine kinase
MKAASALSRLTGPLLRRLPILVAVAFGLYALALLGYYYAGWQRMKGETNAFLVADSQRRASTLTALIDEIRNEAERHAEIQEIRSYLLNRDLGMSLRYGLYASLQAIEERFSLHAQHAWSERPNRILFIDIEGNRLADSAPNDPLPADGLTTKTRVDIDAGKGIVLVAVPVIHKGNLEGNVITITSTAALYRNLIRSNKENGYHELLLMANGDPLPGDPQANVFNANELQSLALAPDDEVVSVAALQAGNVDARLADNLLIKSPVPGLGMYLVTLVQTERAQGHLASPRILFVAGLVPVLLLLGALRLDRMRIATERLQLDMRLMDERRAGAERRNAELAAEIGRREQVEAALKEQTIQLNTIFDLSPDGFVSFDQTMRVSYVSPAFLRMTRLEEHAFVGLDEKGFSALLRRISAPDTGFPGIDALRAAGTSHVAPHERVTFTLANPHPRVIQAGLRSAGSGMVAQIIYFHDITLESEVDRMKSEFLSTAAHELRTPITSVLGYAEVLQHGEFDEATRRDFIDTIHRNSQLMAKIINELLDLSRIEARRGQDFNFEVIEAGPLIAATVANFKTPEGRSAPEVELAAGSHPVRGDRSKLIQAITNILSNAYKYSPDGGAVCLSLEREDGSDGAARVGLRVRDHGIGLTPEQSARVCERFYRADDSGKIPGTGLGMSIVKEIIELHGGTVAVDSKPGAGTTVTLWLPLAAEGNQP